MEKKQLFNSSLVGFHPNTFIPFYQLQVNIGTYNYEEEFNIEETISLDNTFINIYNKHEIGQNATIKLDIISDTIESGTVAPIFNGYKDGSNLYFQNSTIINPGKDNENILIRNFKITNIDVTAKTANIGFAQKIINLISSGNGDKYLSDDGKYKTIEVGDKTNVLILSLENDLANGQKDSPVTAEVSTALKNAISAGKACVIKSANSDILANLQQTGNNVTIVMEQISRVGQTFVAVNTTITVNTSTNIISDYQTGAIVLETEGDGSKFLSDDGTYKEINTSGESDVYIFSPQGETITLEEYTALENAIKSGKVICLYSEMNSTVGNCIIQDSNNIFIYSMISGSFYLIAINKNKLKINTAIIGTLVVKEDVLTKNNITEYTPTNDYNPATKKYVDDSIPELATTLTSGLMSKEDKAKLDGKNSLKDINLDSIINKIKAEPQGTDVDITSEFNSLFGSWSEFKSNVRRYNYINQPYTINGDNSSDRYTWTTIYSNFNEGDEVYSLYKYLVWLDGDSIMGRVTRFHLSKTSGENNALYGDGNYKRTLSCTNTTEFTPTADYNPATKKYVDNSNYYYNKSNVELSTKSVTLGNKTYNFNYYYKLDVIKVSNGFVATINIIRNDDTVRNITSAQFGNITLDDVNLSACIEFIDTIKDTDTKEYVKIRYYINADLIVNANNRTIDYDINSTSVRIEEAMVTESEYSAIGHTSTDNILYFVTPD